ncbi:MAG: CcoQ/FixQ family Cbb3-type cytochrome c oxidase assembly chaperone [Gammaproteobacteria bacterium]|nr:MAG: CcoQ/FixQ family Cbb3-type cytochrome c oxidase assembly chaperone [Gammaproteobacteria bacterium]
MNAIDMGLFHSIWTVLLFAVFIGIIVWAWSGQRKHDFDKAAHLPLEDDKEFSSEVKSGENNHG